MLCPKLSEPLWLDYWSPWVCRRNPLEDQQRWLLHAGLLGLLDGLCRLLFLLGWPTKKVDESAHADVLDFGDLSRLAQPLLVAAFPLLLPESNLG